MDLTWANLGWTLGFAAAGLLLMFLGLVGYDLLVPFRLFHEIHEGNQAVAWLASGYLISTGIILGKALSDHLVFLNAVAYGALGVVLNYVAYFAWEFLTPRWSLSDAIARGSTAAGKVMFGLSIAVGLVIAGAMG